MFLLYLSTKADFCSTLRLGPLPEAKDDHDIKCIQPY